MKWTNKQCNGTVFDGSCLWFDSSMRAGSYTFPATHSSGARYGKLHETQCKEQISIAYAQAVVTAARCKLEEIRIDDEKVDAVVRQDADHDVFEGAQLDVQLKCTSQEVRHDEFLSWSLPIKHYDKLRSTKRYVPAILVLMQVPHRLEDWVTQDSAVLRLVQSAHWVNLYGLPAVNANSATIHVPITNTFDVEQLLSMLSRVGGGGRP